MKLTITPEMKARAKAALAAMTPAQRKMIVSGIIAALGLIGVTAFSPDTIDSALTLVLSAVNWFLN